ncbi:hypothetical protein CDAR_169391 [Caerostris darwini]|uniref:Uncharacterized protein n=1 Tax=Caerostris darwini TaxID=1538125 RepID=A0AAV4QMZ2_9ARAC|nr:hypothetical protein CDAR_169391 [Caerostris darwini]
MAALATVVLASCLLAVFGLVESIFQDGVLSLFLVIEYVLVMRFMSYPDLQKTAKIKKTITDRLDERKFKRNLVPMVYSKDVWLLCDALGIEAQLASSEMDNLATMTKSKQIRIPTVKSREIWLFCQALDIKVELASP